MARTNAKPLAVNNVTSPDVPHAARRDIKVIVNGICSDNERERAHREFSSLLEHAGAHLF